MRANLFLITVLASSLIACGKKDNSNGNNSTPEKTVNGLTANQGWCNAELIDDGFELVTKINILDEKNIRMERIRISRDASPVAYRFSKNYEYVGENDYAGYDKFTLKAVKGSDSVQKLKNFSGQETIFNKILSKNSKLEKSVTSFSPVRAVILKASGLLSEDSEQHFYPCDNYSSTFNEALEVRPMVEFQIHLGQAISAYRTEKQLPIKMALKLPIKEIAMGPDKLNGTQWCKWFEFGMKTPQLTILTIKEDIFRDTLYTGALDIYEDHASIFQSTAEDGHVYRIDKSAKNLKGQYEKVINGTSYTRDATFKMIKDASGVTALIQEKSESSIISGYEIYHSCDDQRPLEVYSAYTKWLKEMLDQEMNF